MVSRGAWERRLSGLETGTDAVLYVEIVTVQLDPELADAFAERLRSNLRGSDVVGRLSQRQYVARVPSETSGQVARRLREVLGAPFDTAQGGRKLTFIVSVTTAESDNEDLLWNAVVTGHAEAHGVMQTLFSTTMGAARSLDELAELVTQSSVHAFGADRAVLSVDGRVWDVGHSVGDPNLSLDLSPQRDARWTLRSWSQHDPRTHPAFVSALQASLSVQIERVIALGEADRIARTDPLTGVANRAGLAAHLEAREPHEFGCVAMVDIDHFKRVNDNFGHESGDEVLTAVAGLLVDCSGEKDLVVRWGGEEFLLLLDDGASMAEARCEQMRSAIARAVVAPDGSPVTVSVGVVPVTTSFDAARQAADTALYEAKAHGRNRTQLRIPTL